MKFLFALIVSFVLFGCSKQPTLNLSGSKEERKKSYDEVTNILSEEDRNKFDVAFAALFSKYGKEMAAVELNGLTANELIQKASISCTEQEMKQAEIIAGAMQLARKKAAENQQSNQ